MNTQVKTRGFELTKGLKNFTKTKLDSSLTRFSQKIHSIKVILSDINGPKGGKDKKCLIYVHLGQANPVVIQHTDDDMYHSISLCCVRAKNAIKRHVGKSQKTKNEKLHQFIAQA